MPQFPIAPRSLNLAPAPAIAIAIACACQCSSYLASFNLAPQFSPMCPVVLILLPISHDMLTRDVSSIALFMLVTFLLMLVILFDVSSKYMCLTTTLVRFGQILIKSLIDHTENMHTLILIQHN